MVERITYQDEWFDNVVLKGKLILEQLAKETFHRYREVGKLVLESGYQKGQWYSKHRKEAIDKWGISQQTFRRIIQIGEMSEEEFAHAVSNFSSIHAWANQGNNDSNNETPILPNGKYSTIIIDPPWPVKKILRKERPLQEEELDYRILNIDQIKALPLHNLTNDNCHVYLWTTHKFLPTAFEIFESWGVNFECLLTWVKNVGFTPYSWMYSTEHVLFGRMGSLELLEKGKRLDFYAKVREHSRKPNEFYDLVRQVSPEPRIDLFARENHEGFDVWGNEVNKFDVV